MKWRRRPEIIEAEQFDPEGDPVDGVVGRSNPGVWSEVGWSPVRKGDWVVVWPDGRRRVYSDTYFRAYFERAGE